MADLDGSSDSSPGEGEKTVPQEEFDRLLGERLEPERRKQAALEADNAALRERLTAVEVSQQAKAPAAEKSKEILSRAVLQEAVDSGTISQSRMDARLEEQAKWKDDKLREEIRNEALQAVRQESASAAIETQIGMYGPEPFQSGHEKHQRLTTEFQALVALGHDPTSRATTVTALRSAFGPPETPRQIEREREPSQETVSGGGAGGGGDEGDLMSKLPKERLEHYEKMLVIGQFKNRGVVNAMLKRGEARRAAG